MDTLDSVLLTEQPKITRSILHFVVPAEVITQYLQHPSSNGKWETPKLELILEDPYYKWTGVVYLSMHHTTEQVILHLDATASPLSSAPVLHGKHIRFVVHNEWIGRSEGQHVRGRVRNGQPGLRTETIECISKYSQTHEWQILGHMRRLPKVDLKVSIDVDISNALAVQESLHLLHRRQRDAVDLVSNQAPFDVCLHFPNHEKALLAHSSMLKQVPYFNAMLFGGFQESSFSDLSLFSTADRQYYRETTPSAEVLGRPMLLEKILLKSHICMYEHQESLGVTAKNIRVVKIVDFDPATYEHLIAHPYGADLDIEFSHGPSYLTQDRKKCLTSLSHLADMINVDDLCEVIDLHLYNTHDLSHQLATNEQDLISPDLVGPIPKAWLAEIGLGTRLNLTLATIDEILEIPLGDLESFAGCNCAIAVQRFGGGLIAALRPLTSNGNRVLYPLRRPASEVGEVDFEALRPCTKQHDWSALELEISVSRMNSQLEVLVHEEEENESDYYDWVTKSLARNVFLIVALIKWCQPESENTYFLDFVFRGGSSYATKFLPSLRSITHEQSTATSGDTV